MNTTTSRIVLLTAALSVSGLAHSQTSLAEWIKLDQAKVSALTGPADYKGWIIAADPATKIDLHAIAEKTTSAKWGGGGTAFQSQLFYRQPSTLPASQPRITRTITEGNRIIALVLEAPRRATWDVSEWKAAGFNPGSSALQKLTGQGQSGTETVQYHQWKQTLTGNESVFASLSGFGTNFGMATITRDQRIPTWYLPDTAPGLVVEWLQDQRRADGPHSIDVSLPGSVSIPDALSQVGIAPGTYETVAHGEMTEVRLKSGYLATKRFPTYFVNQRGEREVMGEAGYRMTVSQLNRRTEFRVSIR